MGIVFMASADIRDLSVFTTNNGVTISSVTARTGTYSYLFAGGHYVTVAVPARADYYLKCGWWGNKIDSAQRHRICFREGTTKHLTFLLDLTSGTIQVRRGDENGTLLGSTSGVVISASTWNCVEIYANVHDSTGSVTIKVNGTQRLALTGQDTRNGLTGVIDNVYFYSDDASMYIDDIVIGDAAFAGTGGLYLLTPDGDGSDTGWTASTGSRYTCVDEVPPSATDNISTDAGTANVKNTCTFGNLPITPQSIASVAVLAKAKLSAAGTGNIRAIVKSGTTYGNGSSFALTTTETWVSHFTTLDPDTAAAWGLAGVNALSGGVETL